MKTFLNPAKFVHLNKMTNSLDVLAMGLWHNKFLLMKNTSRLTFLGWKSFYKNSFCEFAVFQNEGPGVCVVYMLRIPR